jgi:tetratricopeptide (TPR) repeat protein
MQNKFLLAALILTLTQALSAQKIAELYDKDKYAAIVQLAENADSTTVFSTLEMYRIGRSYFNTENVGKALDYFQKALAAGRDSANVHYFIGVCHKEFKEYDKAMAAFDNAIKLDSTDQYAWAEKGLVYVSQEKLTEGKAAFEKAVSMPYQYVYPYYVTLVLYNSTKDYAKMPAFYQKWEKTFAKSEHYQVEAWRLMGSYEKSRNKNLPKALGYCEKVLEKDLLNMNAYEEVIKIHVLQQNWKKADKVFERLKTAFNDKRLNQDDLKREAAIVEITPLNDTINTFTVRYFKKPTEFAEPIYKTYIINTPKDSTIMVLLTEKSLSLFNPKEDNHMLCGRRGGTHMNYGMITRNGEVKYADYRKRIWEILNERFKPVASSTFPTKDKD